MSKIISEVVAVVVVMLHVFWSALVAPGFTRVAFLDVGQGDSVLIQSDGLNILVDGSAGDQVLHQLGKYLKPGDMHIDLLIISHPHQDHINGAIDLLERYEVEAIAINPVCYNSYNYNLLLQYEDKFIFPKAGSRLTLGELTFDFLYPATQTKVQCNTGLFHPSANINNDSLVFTLSYGDTSILFTGDAEKEVERELLLQADLKKVDILKGGHHCSNTSNSKEFLEVVRPKLVICSAGYKNLYGHPGDITLKNFNELGVEYLVTWEQGDIVIDLSP